LVDATSEWRKSSHHLTEKIKRKKCKVTHTRSANRVVTATDLKHGWCILGGHVMARRTPTQATYSCEASFSKLDDSGQALHFR